MDEWNRVVGMLILGVAFFLFFAPSLCAEPWDVHGFYDFRLGARQHDDPHQSPDIPVAEARWQIDASRMEDWGEIKVKGDMLYDYVEEDLSGRMREAYVLYSPNERIDMKLGRQICTWGTGDLLFINDLFPKDWNSFFLGREDEYLKAPSDALKVSFFELFGSKVNLHVVYTPRFDSDRFIDGRRVSYWNDGYGRIVGREAPVLVERPDDWFDDDELALRFSWTVSSVEYAAYYYHGFWKSPAGSDPSTGLYTFPALEVVGFSVRGPFGRGIGNVEVGYYDSTDDPDGDDPMIRNGEFRLLLGYEREIGRDYTMGLQYYLEHMFDHGAYLATLPAGVEPRDQDRQVFTVRLTKLLKNQTLKYSLFAYLSPTDGDVYLRPKVHYDINDDHSVEVGANIFLGKDDYTFFGQFEDANNVYAAYRIKF